MNAFGFWLLVLAFDVLNSSRPANDAYSTLSITGMYLLTMALAIRLTKSIIEVYFEGQLFR